MYMAVAVRAAELHQYHTQYILMQFEHLFVIAPLNGELLLLRYKLISSESSSKAEKNKPNVTEIGQLLVEIS